MKNLKFPLIRRYLTKNNIKFEEKKCDGHATIKRTIKLKSPHTGSVDLYKNGTVYVQKSSSIYGEMKDLDEKIGRQERKKIFLVYAFKESGKMESVKSKLEEWGFEVLLMVDESNNSNFLLEKLEQTLYQADYGLVLLTNDNKVENEDRYIPQPNVLFEMGMLRAHLKDKKHSFSILNYGFHSQSIPTDISGVAYADMSDFMNNSGQDKDKEFEERLMKEVYHLYHIEN